MAKLRRANVGLDKGLKVREVCKQLGISEQTYYRQQIPAASVSRPNAVADEQGCAGVGSIGGRSGGLSSGRPRDDLAAWTRGAHL